MNLPFFGKKEKKEYFLAILIRDEKVTAVIFEELSGKVRVVGKNEAYLSTIFEEATIEEWLESFDKAISGAEETIPENVETQKTIFGVKETWVEDSKIKKAYLLRLKKVSDTLGLIPIGFLVIHEAIAHLLQETEGAPVSGILIEIGQKHTTVSLLRAGRVIETRRTTSEDNIAQSTDKMLHHFTNYEVLPSRILVLSNKTDNEKLSQSFISHTWSKSLPFLHVPQITILPKNFDAKAVLSGAISQMGFELLTGTENQPIKKEIISTGIAQEKPEEEHSEDNFGFLKGTDIRINTIKQEEDPKEKIDEELSEIQTSKIQSPFQEHTDKKTVGKTFLSGLSLAIKECKKILSILPKTTPGGPKKGKFIFIIIILVVSILGFFISYIFFIKADVTIFVTPKVVEQKQDIVFSTKNPTDIEKRNIIAQAIELDKQGKTTRKATGKKEVGEKTKGSVTIYNNTSENKTFPAGTILISSNNLTFTLDKDSPLIASASGDAISGTTPGKANVSVTAGNIGKESNLPSGTIFSIKSFDKSDIAAKNDAAFSGGTKKEVVVVSKNDITSAIEELINNLENSAIEEMTQKMDTENKILPFITNTTFSQNKLDKKVDEEASTFTIEGTVTFEGLTYQENDAQQFVKNLLDKDIDPELTLDTTTYTLQDTKKGKNNDITSTILAKAYLLPKIEKEKLTKDIAGKSFINAKNIIEKMPQINNVQIKLKPNIPFLPHIMPKFLQNIAIFIEKE